MRAFITPANLQQTGEEGKQVEIAFKSAMQKARGAFTKAETKQRSERSPKPEHRVNLQQQQPFYSKVSAQAHLFSGKVAQLPFKWAYCRLHTMMWQ